MRLSHTLLLVSMLSFGGFMVSKLVHAMVTPTGELREVPERVIRPIVRPQNVATPVDPKPMRQQPLLSCPLLKDEGGDERSAKSPAGRDVKAKEAKSPKCRCDLRRKQLHLI